MNLNRIISILIIPIFLYSCKSAETRQQENINKTNVAILKKDSLEQNIENMATKPPIINLMDSFIQKQTVIFVKDSSLKSADITTKLNQIFDSILPAFAKKNNIEIISKKMVWYKSLQSPFFFEGGFTVNKTVKAGKPVLVKTIGGDSALVANYFGPYSNTVTAYDVIYERLADMKKKKKGDSYEVYIDDPFDAQGKPKNPYRVGTDVVVPYQ